MASAARNSTKTKPSGRPSDQLTDAQLLKMYKTMVLSRKLDERSWVMNRQGRAPFHISGIGHEAIQVAAAETLRPGYDWFYPYYRDLAFVLAMGMKPVDHMLGLLGKAGDPSSGGIQMPSHFSNAKLRIGSISSPVATQVPIAAGTALASKLKGVDEVTVVCLGEGSTSQGDFHEGLNWAGVHKLPFICIVQNNQYAISVPVEKEMAVKNVADRAAAYGIKGVVVDGNDVLVCYDVMVEAVERARRGEGATLVEAKTYRVTPHSSDDDDRTYRSREEVEYWKQRDPILLFENVLFERGILTEDLKREIEDWAIAEVDKAEEEAVNAPYPDVSEMYEHLYGPAPNWEE
ncbi:MAG TPA: thiamine pyrophosphate-dependent dehydrogenase E1 component subunit alpha [Anaerolineae bacterium]|nr:thiamine pyrophosphate-dependent dehydrogenase E1 component subunit alpha [Caldilineae bacterium]HID33935.1 thiamine pyrophosphate-dependent dehydrogenase E1 component subunit alpha [Anaerolineae bacterium]